MKKKLLSGLLILSLLMGTIAGTALAETGGNTDSLPGTESAAENTDSRLDGSDVVIPNEEDSSVPADPYDPSASDNAGDVSDGDLTLMEDPALSGTPEVDAASTDEEVYHVRYTAHVQSYGWMDPAMDGAMVGTSGQAKRMEALKIEVLKEVPAADASADSELVSDNESAQASGTQLVPVTGAIAYSAHVQSIGWQDYVTDGAMIGTSGLAKRVEGFRLRLTGEVAEKYDIYYRTYLQTFGWMDWAKNDEIAGSTGLSKRMEAMEIRLVKKGDPAPGKTDHPCYSPTCKGDVTYQTHVQTYGWMDSVADGKIGGTEGQAKRMEAIRIWLNAPKDAAGNVIPGSIEYSAHVQSYGWMDPVTNGELCGTSGQAKRVEAIRIRLTGELAEKYHIYYRVHAQSFGTLGWARDGEDAGTSGLAKRLEYLQIKLVSKDDTAAIAELEASGTASVSADMIGALNAGFYNQKTDTWDDVSGQKVSIGASGVERVNEGLKVSYLGGADKFSGGIRYEVHVGGIGWMAAGADGSVSGLPDGGHEIQAVKLSLTGDLAKYCDIYYRSHIQAYGWIGWAKNGQISGSTGCGYRLEALEICLVLKGASAPGVNADYYKTVKKGSKMIALTFDDGPGARTMELLNCLERNGAHATFFVIGQNISRYSSCLTKAVKIGCEVGNHTYTHPTLTRLSTAGINSEISRTNSLIRQYTGSNAPVMRPPGGGQNATVRAAVGMPVILWSVDTNDWKTLSTSTTYNHVMANAKDGDIILMHDIHSSTVSAALQLIPALQARGFQLVTVSELAQAKGVKLNNGSVYSSIR